MVDKNSKDFFNSSVGAMKTELSTFLSHYKDVSGNIAPRRGRFLVSDTNRGGNRYQKIINSRGTQAFKIARAGMMSGLMSPSSPWFALGAPDPDKAEIPEVKIWISHIQRTMRAIFENSNLGIMTPKLIGELLLFATGAMFDDDDFDDVSRFYVHTAGSYMIAQNEKQIIDTFAREFQVTAINLISWFGLDNVSSSVKDQYRRGNYHSWFPVVHYVDPNPDSDRNSKRSDRKPFRSVYYEPGGTDKNLFLSKKGYDEFPVYVPRWDTTDGDIYGTDCPAMTALGDIRGLHVQEREKAKGVAKMVSPPLKGPANLKNASIESVPGGFTPADSTNAADKLESIYNVRLPISEMRADIDAVERRINEAFMVDMFLAISNMEGIQPKNELELSQRNNERLLQLGPVLQGFHKDFLNNLIDRTFNKMVRLNLVPPPPKALQGEKLKVEYVSTLAMAQRAIATSGIERMGNYVAGLAQTFGPDVLDKFDADQSIDEYASVIAIPPKIIVSDEDVRKKREARAQQQQRQAQLDMAAQASAAAKDASQSSLDGDSVLSRGVKNLTGEEA